MGIERKLLLIIIIVAIVIFTLPFFYKPIEYQPLDEQSCQIDPDCVPEQCCHPSSCVNINYRPDCTEIFCTQVCEGPIDCGAGSCKCVNSKCQVVPTK